MSSAEAPTPTVDVPTVVGMSVVVFAVALAVHELAHAVVASLHGADPALVSSTDMRGDMSALDQGATAWTAAAGSLANWGLAFLGLAILHAATGPSGRILGWIVAAVNGLIPATYMIASPLIGFGDWMTAIARLDARAPLRVVVGVVGVGLLAGWARLLGRRLELLLDPVADTRREHSAVRLTRTVWISGGTLALAASLFSPLGPFWAIPIALGSTLGTTWPLLPIGPRRRDMRRAGSGPARLDRGRRRRRRRVRLVPRTRDRRLRSSSNPLPPSCH
jgi:hypothetical protein